MDLEVYGAAGQKKLARYPERFMLIQKLQTAIPNIENLNLDETIDLRRRFKRFANELGSYEIAIKSVIRNYELIIKEAKEDCAKMERLIEEAPTDTKEDRILSLRTSVVQTGQQVQFFEQQCQTLHQQLETIASAEKAIEIAQKQNDLSRLSGLLAQLKLRDLKIHQT